MVIATYGDWKWAELAQERAVPSAQDQAPVVCWHDRSLAEARNRALKQVATEWVVHLDADDQLEPGYVEAMGKATADLRAPAVRYVGNKRERTPMVPKVVGHSHDCEARCLLDGNWLVVGTAVRTEMVREVGGWRDQPLYEDWDLFLRCYLAGATIEAVPGAVYRAQINAGSRNRAPGRDFRLAAHKEIHYANGLPDREWPRAA